MLDQTPTDLCLGFVNGDGAALDQHLDGPSRFASEDVIFNIGR
jgi:hypothetical protein